jgi:ureidoglycolate lyase
MKETTMQALPLTDGCLEPYATQLRCRSGLRTAYPVVTEIGNAAGKPVFSVMSHQPVEGDIVVSKLERHPHSSQTFLPLTSGRWLVLVAPAKANGDPDMEAARAFVADPGDAVCFHRNVWHAGLMVLDKPAEISMMMWRTENGDDATLFDLPTPIVVKV